MQIFLFRSVLYAIRTISTLLECLMCSREIQFKRHKEKTNYHRLDLCFPKYTKTRRMDEKIWQVHIIIIIPLCTTNRSNKKNSNKYMKIFGGFVVCVWQQPSEEKKIKTRNLHLSKIGMRVFTVWHEQIILWQYRIGCRKMFCSQNQTESDKKEIQTRNWIYSYSLFSFFFLLFLVL